MKQEILKKVKEQLAKDYNCSVEDFDNRNNLITNIKLNEGDRRYTDDKEILKILVFNGKAILSADECIKEWFKDDNRFDEAFAFDNNFPDVLAVAKIDERGNILGMAGASKDSDVMWQIGINVLEGAEEKGVAKTVVKALKNEILRRGKVPFYGTVESHIISQKVALASGFYPAFAEVKIRKI